MTSPTKQPITVEVEPEIAVLALTMQEALDMNIQSGDWRQFNDVSGALRQFLHMAQRVASAVGARAQGIIGATSASVLSAVADLSNFGMFLANQAGAFKPDMFPAPEMVGEQVCDGHYMGVAVMFGRPLRAEGFRVKPDCSEIRFDGSGPGSAEAEERMDKLLLAAKWHEPARPVEIVNLPGVPGEWIVFFLP